MTKSNWRNELYLGERVGGAGTLVRQGIRIGGKKGGRVVQKGTTSSTAAGKSQVQKELDFDLKPGILRKDMIDNVEKKGLVAIPEGM